MTENAYPIAQPSPTEARIERGQVIASTPGAIRRVSTTTFAVKSQSGVSVYRVEKGEKTSTCNCPDAVTHEGTGCKHIAAVRFYLQRETLDYTGAVTTQRVPITYSQAWSAYDAAQKSEVKLFDQLLSELVSDIVDPRPAQVRGQPRLPLSDLIFTATQKVYSQLSCRRAYSLFGFATERGQINRPPSYSMSSIVLNREDVTPILHDLIAKVALPLAGLEEGFAVDSSGFRTTCYGQYCQEKHGESRANKWLKAHVIVGVKTQIIPQVIVTDGNASDTTQYAPLLNQTVDAGFVMKEVYADKGYLSRENYNVTASVGATPYIAFKQNSRGHSRGGGKNGPPSPMWKRMYHLFQANRDEWEPHYYLRENVEATFAAIKKKLGETLKSKNPVSQTNELLCKVLAYNLTVLIHEMFEHNVVPNLGVKVVKGSGGAEAIL